jgi:hypothetical protein
MTSTEGWLELEVEAWSRPVRHTDRLEIAPDKTDCANALEAQRISTADNRPYRLSRGRTAQLHVSLRLGNLAKKQEQRERVRRNFPFATIR